MRQDIPAKSDDARGFAIRLSLFYGALFIGFGLHQPFFPVWLQAKALSETEIATILACGLLIRLAATPIITFLADRGGSLSLALVVCAFATAVSFVGVGLSSGFVMILIGVIIAGFVWSPIMPLLDAYGLAGVARRGLDYGRIRVWGSVAYMGANLAGGAFLAVFAPEYFVWLIAASLAPLVAASLMLPHDRRTIAKDERRTGFLDRRFILIASAAAMLQASHAVYYAFSAIHWKSVGLSGTTVGFLWALAVMSEIALFFLSGRLPKGLRPSTFLIVGGGLGVLRWIAFALDPGVMLLIPLQLLHAASFGLVHLGLMAYLAERLPPHARASGQGLASVALGAFMAGATLVAGPLYQRVGASAYLAMALLSAIGIAWTLYARSLPRLVAQPQSDGAGG